MRLAKLVPKLAAAAAAGGMIAARASRPHGEASAEARHELRADDETVGTLNHLYEGLPNGDEIPLGDQHAIDASGGHEAYGELTVRGMRELRSRLRPQHGDVFYDLGSGCGRSVVQAALEWPVARAVGVELAASRHSVGQDALARVSEDALRARIVLRRGDIIACEGCEDATIVYVASLLFDDAFMSRLAARLSELPRLRAVATLTRFPPGALAGFHEAAANAAPDHLEAVRRERVEVTWGAARVFVYERHATEGA